MELNGAHALVTGASKGIGEAISRQLAEAGATVSMVARSGDLLEPLAKELDGHYLAADLTADDHLDGLVARVEDQAGRPVDVLVNNAGVEVTSMLEDMDDGEIARVISLDLTAPLRLARQALPGMIERDRGHIVQVSSAAGVMPVGGLTAYSGAKAGLTHSTRSLRQELRGTSIVLTTATLGPIDTGMWDRVTDNPPFERVANRLDRLQLIPKVAPETVAHDVVAAIEGGKRYVRHPKRASALFALAEAPGRITNALLAGVKPRNAR